MKQNTIVLILVLVFVCFNSYTQVLNLQTFSPVYTEEPPFDALKINAPYNSGQSFQILQGGDVIFRASNKIILNPGFKVINGGEFNARIDIGFDNRLRRFVLEGYLSKALSMHNMADNIEEANNDNQRIDDIRMIKNTGAKFINRAAGIWGLWSHSPFNWNEDNDKFDRAAETAALIHIEDPSILIQAAIFEYIDNATLLKTDYIPSWVFQAYDLPVPSTPRKFNFYAMVYDDYVETGAIPNGNTHTYTYGAWAGVGVSPRGGVPDISKLETQMYFFYRAVRYIEAGFEAIHFGDVHRMLDNDPSYFHIYNLCNKIRSQNYKARRNKVIIDAHTFGIAYSGNPVFDFHSNPIRMQDVQGTYNGGNAKIVADWYNIYGKSLSGLPVLVEFDHWGYASDGSDGQYPGVYNDNWWWTWGWDDISWFAMQDYNSREAWLSYAWQKIRCLDQNVFIAMPGKRLVTPGIGFSCPYPTTTYNNAGYANSSGCFYRANFNMANQENKIKELFGSGLLEPIGCGSLLRKDKITDNNLLEDGGNRKAFQAIIDINISPNPSNGRFSISGLRKNKVEGIKVYNLKGEEIIVKQLVWGNNESSDVQVLLDDVQNGLILVKIYFVDSSCSSYKVLIFK